MFLKTGISRISNNVIKRQITTVEVDSSAELVEKLKTRK